MKYRLVKTVECSVESGCYSDYHIGDTIPYGGRWANHHDLNDMMRTANGFNSMSGCKCQVEVREVEE